MLKCRLLIPQFLGPTVGTHLIAEHVNGQDVSDHTKYSNSSLKYMY